MGYTFKTVPKTKSNWEVPKHKHKRTSTTTKMASVTFHKVVKQFSRKVTDKMWVEDR